MKDNIFSDLYDRVLSFFTSQSSESKSLAKNRLKTVLMQDRVGFSERAMQMLKDDMLSSISKYLEIDTDAFDLSIDAQESAMILNLSIPVLRPKTDEEIDEALEKEENENIEKTKEIVGEIEELVKEKAQKLAEQINEEETEEEISESKVQDTEEEEPSQAPVSEPLPSNKTKKKKHKIVSEQQNP